MSIWVFDMMGIAVLQWR